MRTSRVATRQYAAHGQRTRESGQYAWGASKGKSSTVGEGIRADYGCDAHGGQHGDCVWRRDQDIEAQALVEVGQVACGLLCGVVVSYDAIVVLVMVMHDQLDVLGEMLDEIRFALLAARHVHEIAFRGSDGLPGKQQHEQDEERVFHRKTKEGEVFPLRTIGLLYPPGRIIFNMSLHASHPAIIKRLKRAHGHLASVIQMLEAERPCVELAQQLQAVESAINSAKKTLIHDHISHCLADGHEEVNVVEEFKAIAKYL